MKESSLRDYFASAPGWQRQLAQLRKKCLAGYADGVIRLQDATLEEWAGITTEDLRSTDGVLYLEAYDAYYTFTSDFGPGVFLCTGGESDGETARLWTETGEDGSREELVLQRDGEDWHIRSFQTVQAAG